MENQPSDIPEEVREQIKAEVREQMEEANSMGTVAFWFRIGLIGLLLVEWLVFGFEHVAVVLEVVRILLQRWLEI